MANHSVSKLVPMSVTTAFLSVAKIEGHRGVLRRVDWRVLLAEEVEEVIEVKEGNEGVAGEVVKRVGSGKGVD